ncbi:hypothetical protein T492DRAFT_843982 [Pavlovales sp. CCMP2436]|nr:hypothetical protein T492DRAFT_843982 [Pavlovales sp. CCMP2436]
MLTVGASPATAEEADCGNGSPLPPQQPAGDDEDVLALARGKRAREYFRESILVRMRKVLDGDELEQKVRELTAFVQRLSGPPQAGSGDHTLWQLWQIAGQAEVADRDAGLLVADEELFDQPAAGSAAAPTNSHSNSTHEPVMPPAPVPCLAAVNLGALVCRLESALAHAASSSGEMSEEFERALVETTAQLEATAQRDASGSPGAAIASNEALTSRLEIVLAGAATVFSRQTPSVERNGLTLLAWLRACTAPSSLDSLEDVQAALASAASWRLALPTSLNGNAGGVSDSLAGLAAQVIAAELRAEERALEITLTRSAASAFGHAFPTATTGRIELAVSGERRIATSTADPNMSALIVHLDGKVWVELDKGAVVMSGSVCLHHELPHSAGTDQPAQSFHCLPVTPTIE